MGEVAVESAQLQGCDLMAPVFSATDGLDAAVEAMHGALPPVLAEVTRLIELREAVRAHTRALLAFDCVTDEVPDDVDVPDDYERGLLDAASGYAQILADLTSSPGKGGAR